MEKAALETLRVFQKVHLVVNNACERARTRKA